MSAIVQLVRPAVSWETVEALTAARDAAARGEVIGVAVVLLHPGRQYTVDAVGIAKDDPTWTRGALAKLGDELGALPHQK